MPTPNRQSLTLLEIKQDLLLVRHKSQPLHCGDSCDGYSGLKYGGGGLVYNSCTIVVYREYFWKEPS